MMQAYRNDITTNPKGNWQGMVYGCLIYSPPTGIVISSFVWPTSARFNTLRPRQNGRHFADDIIKWIFMNENVWISIYISLKFVPRGPINNIPALVQVMAWRRLGDKPLSEPMMVWLLTHICVTRPQWDKLLISWFNNLQLSVYGLAIVSLLAITFV